ncbi:MAG: Uma2 family endonuclease [Rhizobacter sp.]|nr:Uma2 family endonuclease [Chlorobiales bacterium]
MQTLAKPVTYAEYRALDTDDHFLYELINGELVQKSAPSPFHQLISGNLYTKLRAFVEGQNLGTVLFAPVDLFIDDNNTPQPDLMFIAAKNRHFITNDGVFGAPDLVVEIISPSSITRDRVEKQRLYHRFGIMEYWIVDPQNKSIEVYTHTPSGYEVHAFAAEKGQVVSKVLTGFEVRLSDIFT